MTDQTERKRLGWGFWTMIAGLAALTMYPLSYGPVMWMARFDNAYLAVARPIYVPLEFVMRFCRPLRVALEWWSNLMP